MHSTSQQHHHSLRDLSAAGATGKGARRRPREREEQPSVYRTRRSTPTWDFGGQYCCFRSQHATSGPPRSPQGERTRDVWYQVRSLVSVPRFPDELKTLNLKRQVLPGFPACIAVSCPHRGPVRPWGIPPERPSQQQPRRTPKLLGLTCPLSHDASAWHLVRSHPASEGRTPPGERVPEAPLRPRCPPDPAATIPSASSSLLGPTWDKHTANEEQTEGSNSHMFHLQSPEV